jgi:hypothetical protein
MHYIDAHVHVWTPDTAHYPLAAGYKKDAFRSFRSSSKRMHECCRSQRGGEGGSNAHLDLLAG